MDAPATAEAPRPVRLPTFVPPEIRPVIEAAVNEAAKDPSGDPVRNHLTRHVSHRSGIALLCIVATSFLHADRRYETWQASSGAMVQTKLYQQPP